MEGPVEVFFFISMDRTEFEKVVEKAVAERGCSLVDIMFNDDDNVFEVTIDKADADVELADCEYVHRAVLAAFDRNIEDYALTVGSAGISGAEADALLKEMEEQK